MLSRGASRLSSARSTAQMETIGVKSRRIPLGRVSNNYSKGDLLSKPTSREPTRAPPSRQVAPVQPFEFINHQIGDIDNAQDVVQYEGFVYRSLRQKELKEPPVTFNQTGIVMKDRNLLVDALCRVHFKLNCLTNTFYRMVGILDRYLSVAQVSQENLKVVGSACMLIASKIEDVLPAQSYDLVELSLNNFTVEQLFAVEVKIINAIGFNTTFATPLFYLTQFVRLSGDDVKATQLRARYIMEIMQSCEHFYGMKASEMAAVALYVTRLIEGEEPWPRKVEEYTGYSEAKIRSSVKWIQAMILEKDRQETKFMRRKYGSELFLNVADIHWPQ